MKGQILRHYALSVIVAVSVACSAQAAPKTIARHSSASPSASTKVAVVTKTNIPQAVQPSQVPNMPTVTPAPAPGAGPSMQMGIQPSTSVVTPSGTNVGTQGAQPGTYMGAPSGMGAQPGTSMGTPSTSMGSQMGAGTDSSIAVDGNNVYVFQGGKLYKFAKSELSNCGTPLPPSEPCPSGAGPACPTCPGIMYIPGYPTTNCTVKTCTPCPPPANPCNPCGAGPAEVGPCKTIVKCTPVVNSCTCPKTACSACPVCSSCPKESCTTCTTPCSTTGAGPCPPIATVSACAQEIVNKMNGLCGADVDKAFLIAMIQYNQSILALSDASAVYLGTTSLQDWATNSIADAKVNISKAEKWLRTKFCLTTTSCVPSLSPGLNICEVRKSGREFDEAFKEQMTQYYIDIIAISQVEMERGLDSEVKDLAAKVISNTQANIERLTRCSICR